MKKNQAYKIEKAADVAECDAARKGETQETGLQIVELNFRVAWKWNENINWIGKNNWKKELNKTHCLFIPNNSDMSHNVNTECDHESVWNVKYESESGLVKPIPEQDAQRYKYDKKMRRVGKYDFLWRIYIFERFFRYLNGSKKVSV